VRREDVHRGKFWRNISIFSTLSDLLRNCDSLIPFASHWIRERCERFGQYCKRRHFWGTKTKKKINKGRGDKWISMWFWGGMKWGVREF